MSTVLSGAASVVTAVLTSGARQDPPLAFLLSPDPHGDALRGAKMGQGVRRGPAPAPQRGGSGGQGWDTSPLLTFPKWMKQGDLRGGGARGF